MGLARGLRKKKGSGGGGVVVGVDPKRSVFVLPERLDRGMCEYDTEGTDYDFALAILGSSAPDVWAKTENSECVSGCGPASALTKACCAVGSSDATVAALR